MNGESYDVVGVMPPSFRFPNPEWAIWVPLGLAADQPGRQQSVNLVFRTRPGVTAQAAAAGLGEIARRTTRANSAETGVWRVGTWSLHEYLNHVPQAAPSILALQVAAIFAQLIACAGGRDSSPPSVQAGYSVAANIGSIILLIDAWLN